MSFTMHGVHNFTEIYCIRSIPVNLISVLITYKLDSINAPHYIIVLLSYVICYSEQPVLNILLQFNSELTIHGPLPNVGLKLVT